MSSVTVSNISPETSKQAISDFFSFCGKIKNIETTEGDTSTAQITFEQPTAQKTALLLNNTLLGPSHINVTSDSGDDDHQHSTSDTPNVSGEISQEDKPRSRVLAEYMAQGYVIGDAAVTRALELDNKHGVSARFFNTLQALNDKYHATDKMRAADQSYGVSQKANSWLSGLTSYFEKASNTPTGQKVIKFYTDGARQVQDVHEEARRLADLRREEAGGSSAKAAGLEGVLGNDKPTSTSTDTTCGASSAAPGVSATTAPAAQQSTDAKN